MTFPTFAMYSLGYLATCFIALIYVSAANGVSASKSDRLEGGATAALTLLWPAVQIASLLFGALALVFLFAQNLSRFLARMALGEDDLAATE